MKIVERLLLAYLLLKPYYFFSSGNIQPADVFLILAFASYIIYSRINPSIKKSISKSINDNKEVVLFFALTLIINSVYFMVVGELKFIFSSLYYIFNLMAIISFAYFFKDKYFAKIIRSVFKFNLLIQLIVYILGVGRFYDASRYMGTFNDPNQFAFYVFISFLFIFMINIINKDKPISIGYLALTIALIISSGSTGMILGIVGFISVYLIYFIYNLSTRGRLIRPTLYLLTSIMMGTILVWILVPMPTIQYSYNSLITMAHSNPVAGRVLQKSERASGEADVTLVEERGYDKILHYPEYVLYGAGEGAYSRFPISSSVNEIHATFPSILFYYGIIPFMVLASWLYKKIKTSQPVLLIPYAALIAESFTLLNQRQSLFWIFFLMGSAYTARTTIGVAK